MAAGTESIHDRIMAALAAPGAAAKLREKQAEAELAAKLNQHRDLLERKHRIQDAAAKEMAGLRAAGAEAHDRAAASVQLQNRRRNLCARPMPQLPPARFASSASSPISTSSYGTAVTAGAIEDFVGEMDFAVGKRTARDAGR